MVGDLDDILEQLVLHPIWGEPWRMSPEQRGMLINIRYAEYMKMLEEEDFVAEPHEPSKRLKRLLRDECWPFPDYR